MTIDTFKEIFKNLKLGEIAPSDEDIFKEVADFDKDGVINLEDFKKILTYKPEEEDGGEAQSRQHIHRREYLRSHEQLATQNFDEDHRHPQQQLRVAVDPIGGALHAELFEEAVALQSAGFLRALDDGLLPRVRLDGPHSEDELVDDVESSVGGVCDGETELDQVGVDGELGEVEDGHHNEGVEDVGSELR